VEGACIAAQYGSSGAVALSLHLFDYCLVCVQVYLHVLVTASMRSSVSMYWKLTHLTAVLVTETFQEAQDLLCIFSEGRSS